MKTHRAGLVAFDKESGDLVVLERERPYQGNAKKFVEQFSLPRGEVKGGEDPKVGAIREFIEETKFFPKVFNFKDYTFDLFWHDPIHIKWSYKFYFMECELRPQNCINFELKKLNVKDFDVFSSFPNIPETIKFNNVEKYLVKIMSIDAYINKMMGILPLYGENNYNDFFIFLKTLNKK